MQRNAARFIPAWAGNTICNPRPFQSSAVHPRVGGEHRGIERWGASDMGSSPRGRGTRSDLAAMQLNRRFIPAWAGNTARWKRPRQTVTVHPRVGGEHTPAAPARCVPGGSSPRGRGTQMTKLARRRARRFIPAWAGNTPSALNNPAIPSVHPRVGGEHNDILAISGVKGGSSPRGRGTPGARSWMVQPVRFIPAWAGNTDAPQRSMPRMAVHPRVGGEHSSAGVASSAARGSSPRGRGTLCGSWSARVSRRFIPAWAGNTGKWRASDIAMAVHPRVGGEHESTSTSKAWNRGSSPRGRGTPASRVCWMSANRFIPAWAGNTPWLFR